MPTPAPPPIALPIIPAAPPDMPGMAPIIPAVVVASPAGGHGHDGGIGHSLQARPILQQILLVLFGFTDVERNGAVFQDFAVHFGDGGVGGLRRREQDEPVAFGDARAFVDEQLDAGDLAKLREDLLELGFFVGRRQFVDEDVAFVVVAFDVVGAGASVVGARLGAFGGAELVIHVVAGAFVAPVGRVVHVEDRVDALFEDARGGVGVELQSKIIFARAHGARGE